MACVLEPVPDRRHGEVQLGGERRALLLARVRLLVEGPDSQPADALVDGQEREVQPLSGAVPLVQGAAQAVRQRGRVLAPRRPAGPPLPGREQPVWSTAGGTYIRDPGLKTGVS